MSTVFQRDEPYVADVPRSAPGADERFASDGRALEPDEVSPQYLAAALLRHRRAIVGALLACVTIAVIATLLQRRQYTATASFFPQGRRMPSNLSGLAAQFGVALPAGEAGQSPQFYVSLLTSREILLALADSAFHGSASAPRPLWQQLRVRDDVPQPLRQERAIEALRRNVSGSADAKTGVVTFNVRTRDPALSAQLADALLGRVSAYNLLNRQSQAGAERRFAERRLREVGDELRGAENRLQSFLVRNRDYNNSPILRFEAERLERDVDLRQQLYSSLAQSYEQAKMEEVRDTPVLSIVDRPRRPARPDSRGGVAKVLLGALAGACLGVLLALVRELSGRINGRASATPPDPGAELRDAWDDVKRPWRLLPLVGGRRRATAPR